MEKNLLSCIVASGVVEKKSDNGQMIGFISEKFPIEFKDSVGKTRKDEVVRIFAEMQDLSIKKSEIDLKLISKVAIVIGNHYNELFNTAKKMSDNEVVRLFTGGNISNGTISEYITICKKFYNSKGELADKRWSVFGLRELYDLRKFDDEQLKEFLAILPPIEDGKQYDRKFVLNAIKSYIEGNPLELTDNTTVEKSKTDNKTKVSELTKQLENSENEKLTITGELMNCIDSINAIIDLCENSKKVPTKEQIYGILSKFKVLDALITRNEMLDKENPYNKEVSTQ